MTNQSRSSRSAFARGLAAYLLVSVLQPSVSIAAPADVFSIPAPMIGADPPKAADIKDGDATVSTQTGALTWSYPIAVPPGRNGVAPSLSLPYSSQAPIYGGIAVGFAWNLGAPEIREDTSESRLKTHSPLIELFETDPEADDRFIGLAGRRLVRVVEPTGSGVYASYRAQGDDTFQRYERNAVGQPYWRVRSTDGSVMEFGGATAACSNVSEGYAPLTRTLDSFGNEISYTYQEAFPGECRLKSVEWGANAPSLSHFARVDLVWNESPDCNGIPIGSHTDFRSGTKIVTGASSLYLIRVTAAVSSGTYQSGAFVHTREITLGYSAEHLQCSTSAPNGSPAPHAPHRLLTSIRESAWGEDAPRVDLPAVTLEYGPATEFATPQSETPPWVGNNMSLAWGYRYAIASTDMMDRSPTVERMFVDLDGDSLVDLLENGSGPSDCGAKWRKNLGAPPNSTQPQFVNRGEITVGGSTSLPRLKWHGGSQNPPPPEGGASAAVSLGEKCSLAGQVTLFSNSTNAGLCHDGTPFATTPCRSATDPNDPTAYCDPNGRQCPNALLGDPDDQTQLYYRWLDADGDGLTDLVAAVHGDVRKYDIEQGNYPLGTPPAPEPLPFGQPWPACPGVERCKDVDPFCIANADTLWQIEFCVESAPTIGCHDSIKSPYGTPHSTSHKPYTRCEGLYPWFIFKNLGNGAFDNAVIKYQPIPLESDMGDSGLGPMTGVVSQQHAVIDLDGDGDLDALVKPNPQYGNFWWVWLGDGSGGFEPKRYLFLARPGGSMSQNSVGLLADVSSIEGLFDLNADGYVDHWQEIPGQGNASVWFNTGTEHSNATSITTPYSAGGWGVKPGNDTAHNITDHQFIQIPAQPPKVTYYA